jgi:hypothetical protein
MGHDALQKIIRLVRMIQSTEFNVLVASHHRPTGPGSPLRSQKHPVKEIRHSELMTMCWVRLCEMGHYHELRPAPKVVIDCCFKNACLGQSDCAARSTNWGLRGTVEE